MGLIGFLCKSTAFMVALVAILIGSLMSGALHKTGIFKIIDHFETARGPFYKGMFPALHHDTPWAFTHEDIPDLAGETHFVTGANVGLGYWTARHLAAHGASVIIGCRSQAKCEKAAADIREDTGKSVETALIDLGSFASIRECAKKLSAAHSSIDGLNLNAGIMVPPFSLTKDGLESQIGTNHFGHFLLTKLLLPQVEAAAKAKGVATIVSVSSAAHYSSYPEGILPTIASMNDESQYSRGEAYGQSKLANVLFAQELAERVKSKGILVNSIHPGGVDTELGRHIQDVIARVSVTLAGTFKQAMGGFAWHPRDAALTQLYAAVGPSLRKKKLTGKYFHPIARETAPDPHAKDIALQRRLWQMSEEFIAEH